MNEAFSKPLVKCSHVHKQYSSKAEVLRVLKGLDLELGEKTSCAIMGSSGSGKSTLLSILGGMEHFEAGSIEAGPFRLHELAETSLSAYRAEFVGFVFQFHHLLKDFTALENVALPAYMRGVPRKTAWEKANELLRSVGLENRAHHFPTELSGGERQRAAIARALVNDPKLVLADEPTGNLDSDNASSVRDLLFDLPRISGATVIVATHDRRIAEKAVQVFTLENGILKPS